MKSKIIRFPKGYFTRNKQQNLTPSMIDTLLSACEKQNKDMPFGRADIKGSFSALVNRGLIVIKEESLNGVIQPSWQVTWKAVSMLKRLGIIVACGLIDAPKSFTLNAYQ